MWLGLEDRIDGFGRDVAMVLLVKQGRREVPVATS